MKIILLMATQLAQMVVNISNKCFLNLFSSRLLELIESILLLPQATKLDYKTSFNLLLIK